MLRCLQNGRCTFAGVVRNAKQMFDAQLMIAKLPQGFYLRVLCDAMLQNEQTQPLFYSPRVDRARVLHGQKERLGANPKRPGKHRCVLAGTTNKMAPLENIPY